MLLHPRTVKRWWKLLAVPPDACAGNGCHRWTERAAKRLFQRWRKYWAGRGTLPQAVADKFGGVDSFLSEQRQLKFPFYTKST